MSAIRIATLLVAVLGAARASPLPDAGEVASGSESAWLIAAHAGFAVPSGHVFGFKATFGDPPGTGLRDLVRSSTPVGLEMGYRFGAHASLRLDASIGRTPLTHCPGCQAAQLRRASVLAGWRFHSIGWVLPWTGVGFGVEWLVLPQDTVMVLNSEGFRVNARELWLVGVLMLDLRAGADVPLGHGVTIGPYLGWSTGRYGFFRASAADGTAVRNDLFPKAAHQWLDAGVRCGLEF